jgi:glutamine cyclotransferase
MTRIATPDKPRAATHAAEIVREYGPLPGTDRVAGVTHDGRNVWAATGARLVAFDPATGEAVRSIECACDAGTAFDGKHLWQVAETRIDKIDPDTGKVLASLPTPGNAGGSGLAWAEGSLWLGLHRGRKIVQIDPATGEVKRTIESNRFVTGVTWVDGELWHGTWEAEQSEIRHVDPHSGEVLDLIVMPAGLNVSGLESDGKDLFYAGGGGSARIRAVRRPRSSKAAA